MHIKTSHSSGFSLVELIVTVCIVGVLTAIAVPTFNTVISNNRLTAYSNEFVSALNLARSEAIKRGIQVAVKSEDTTNQWRRGWRVFVDIAGLPVGNTLGAFKDDGDATVCEIANGSLSEDCVLRFFSALPTGLSLTNNTAPLDIITFSALGKTQNRSFILCDTSLQKQSQRDASAKLIIITSTGRARMGIDTDTPADGIPNLADGTNVSCPT